MVGRKASEEEVGGDDPEQREKGIHVVEVAAAADLGAHDQAFGEHDQEHGSQADGADGVKAAVGIEELEGKDQEEGQGDSRDGEENAGGESGVREQPAPEQVGGEAGGEVVEGVAGEADVDKVGGKSESSTREDPEERVEEVMREVSGANGLFEEEEGSGEEGGDGEPVDAADASPDGGEEESGE